MLFVDLTYYLGKDKFEVNSNVKDVKDIVETHLRSQIGKGEDTRIANERNVYNIRIEVDLSFDIFNVSDNCGNKGLRDGILLRYLKQKDES